MPFCSDRGRRTEDGKKGRERGPPSLRKGGKNNQIEGADQFLSTIK